MPLEFGKRKAEKQLVADLFARFNCPSDVDDPATWLAEHAEPEALMGWLMSELEPFARMLSELYEWLADVRATVGGQRRRGAVRLRLAQRAGCRSRSSRSRSPTCAAGRTRPARWFRWADGFDAVDDESSALADFDGPGTDLAQAIEAHQHLEAGQRALILTDSDGLRSSSSCAAQRSSTMRGTCASMSKPTRSSIAQRAGWIRTAESGRHLSR